MTPTRPHRLESRLALSFREARRDIRHGANAAATILRLQNDVAAALAHADSRFDPARFHRACKTDDK